MHIPGPITCTCGGGLDTRVYHDRECPIRLLAAAPALLEALEALLLNNELGEYESQRQGKPRMIEVRDKAHAAIAQAK